MTLHCAVKPAYNGIKRLNEIFQLGLGKG